LFFVAFLVSDKNSSFEKLSPYECGFEPFSDSHSVFNVQFFIVGILFMVFDLELVFIFPWVLNIGSIGLHSFYIMLFFLFLLTIGFIYE
jgi:NADH-quinone oxidoreductase subunit A